MRNGLRHRSSGRGEALQILDHAARDILAQGYSVDYAGESRQFKHEGSAMLMTLS